MRVEAGFSANGASLRFLRARLKPAPLVLATLALIVAPAHADRLALWKIVHGECAPHAAAGQSPPKPCDEIELGDKDTNGDAVLKDLNGIAQLLLIPTARITGIEDPFLLTDAAPNYFAAAWRAHADMQRYLKTSPPRETVAIAVNSEYARSQDQLHLHIDCLKPDVIQALADYAPSLDATWRPMTHALAGRTYWVRRVDSADLEGVFPFRLLADGVPEAKDKMGAWTVAAAPLQLDGRPGFVLLADHADLIAGGHAEDLQDHDCKAAQSH